LLHVKQVTPLTLTLDPFHLSKSFDVRFRARRIEKLDGGITKHQKSSDPYLKFYSIPINQTDYVEIGKTNVIEGSTKPEWDPFTFLLEKISSVDSSIMVECWDKDKGSEDDFIGVCTLSLREMKCMQSKEAGVMLLNKKKKKKMGYKHSGILEVVSVKVNQ